jgi:hypothetical protein
MYTLEQVLADQQDLDTLCADRPLRTRELFSGNSFYGHDYILKHYASLPTDYVLKAIIPHAVYVHDKPHWQREISLPVPVNYIYPPHLMLVYAQATGRLTASFCSPFLYLLKLLEEQPKPARQGTLFFPVHSTEHISAVTDLEKLADTLLALEEPFHPVTVCVYWADYLRGQHLPFQKRGLKIVSAGHRYDPFFLFRFYHLCSLHQYAASNEFGSALFLSIAAGCSFFFHNIEQPVCYTRASRYQQKSKTQIDNPDIKATAITLFSEVCTPPTTEQQQFVAYFLGADFLLSPAQLRKKLLAADILDKIWFFRYKSGLVPAPALPRFLKRHRSHIMFRLVSRLKKAVKTILKLQ